MNFGGDSVSVAQAPIQVSGGGSTPASPLQVKMLVFEECPKMEAVELVRAWHSRLPNTQKGPWQFAFRAQYNGVSYAAALWNNPSARCLPSHWLELRRLVCLPQAPVNTASAFLAWMVRWFRKHHRHREKCISYQDMSVHTGTIYKAAGWIPAYVSKPRVRNRSGNRAGTNRLYRWNINGVEPDAAAKTRWEIVL